MIDRREFLRVTATAGASLALAPELLRAMVPQTGTLLQRAIPSSGEMLPVVSFSPRAEADNSAIKAILQTMVSNGGKVVDVLHGGPLGEDAGRTAANELAISDKFFWTTSLFTNAPPVPGAGAPPMLDAAGLRASLEGKLATLQVPRIDLVMISAGANEAQLATLTQMKKEGRIRYVGVHELLFPANAPNLPYPPTSRLEALMRTGHVDIIGADYHLGDRRLEETILPLAQERKIGVMAYFTFDRGRLFRRVGTTPLPEWAAEFDARTWPQFFIKYVVSHPAITVARTGTTNAAHMRENIGAGTGRMPDAATRKRMAAFMDTLPSAPAAQPPRDLALPASVLDRYVGEYKAASGFTAIFRREGDKLMVKPGNNPEVALIARAVTRFQDPRGPFFEFQVDDRGQVTGLMLEQGQNFMRLDRK